MSNFKKVSYIKKTAIIMAVAVIAVFLVFSLTTKAENAEGLSGESSLSASSSTSEGEISSSEGITPELRGPTPFAIINYDMSSGPITLVNGNNYVIEGSYTGTPTRAAVTIPSGYNGTVELKDASIITTNNSAGILLESASADNTSPDTKVELKLTGNNYVQSCTMVAGESDFGAIDLQKGSQITIDDSGAGIGYLHAQSGGPNSCAAGIGSGYHGKRTTEKLGGNVIIKGGTINAIGGAHGAGIGCGAAGGVPNDPTNVIIMGGNITSVGGYHANGIGTGCLTVPTGILVALPPAVVNSSTTGGASGYVAVGASPTGTVYIGDTASPHNTIKTVDTTLNADIFIVHLLPQDRKRE